LTREALAQLPPDIAAIRTDEQTTVESVESIIAELRAADYLPGGHHPYYSLSDGTARLS
jgi:hypothetical protein